MALSNAAIFSKQFFHREKIILLGANNVHKSRLSRHILHEEFSPFIAASRGSIEGERKLVTVMFADVAEITGFNADSLRI